MWIEENGWITKGIYEIEGKQFVKCCNTFWPLLFANGLTYAQCEVCLKEYILGEDEPKRQHN